MWAPEFFKSNLPRLSTGDLLALAQDAEYRIGSHVSGRNPVDGYVKNQQRVIEIIQEELTRRGNEG